MGRMWDLSIFIYLIIFAKLKLQLVMSQRGRGHSQVRPWVEALVSYLPLQVLTSTV